jgi:excisionase family DNA binding protein
MAQPATIPDLSELPEWLRLHEAAGVLRVDHHLLRRWLRDGTLPGVKIGSRWRMRREDIQAIMAGQKTPAQRRAELLGDDAIAEIRKTNDDAPPLSGEQRDVIRAAFRGGAHQ